MPDATQLPTYAVFDAEGSLTGELRYIAGKLTGTASCALCDISHGWNPRGKREWREACAGLPEVLWLHRDEQPPALAAFTRGLLPCVVQQDGPGYRLLLDREALAACAGDLAQFIERLQIAKAGLAR